MQLLKALVGGLAGGAVGATAATVLQPLLRTATPWSILLAGLGAGLGVRLLCDKNRSFMTGIVSAVTAIVALLGVTYGNSMATIRSAADAEKPLVVSTAVENTEADQEAAEDEAAGEAEGAAEDAASEDSDAGEDDEAREAAEAAAAAAPPEDTGDAAGPESVSHATSERVDGSRAPPPQQGLDWSSMEVILNGVSAFLAYLLGTGSGAAAVAVAAPAKTESTGTKEEQQDTGDKE